jgi:hypothetical protein
MTADHVANLRAINVIPHVTQNQAVTTSSIFNTESGTACGQVVATYR